MIQIMIQIKCLHRTKFLDLDHDRDCDLDHFASGKRSICRLEQQLVMAHPEMRGGVNISDDYVPTSYIVKILIK